MINFKNRAQQIWRTTCTRKNNSNSAAHAAARNSSFTQSRTRTRSTGLSSTARRTRMVNYDNDDGKQQPQRISAAKSSSQFHRLRSAFVEGERRRQRVWRRPFGCQGSSSELGDSSSVDGRWSDNGRRFAHQHSSAFHSRRCIDNAPTCSGLNDWGCDADTQTTTTIQSRVSDSGGCGRIRKVRQPK